jgi:hypothetical protein
MIAKDIYVYVSNVDDEHYGMLGKVTGMRPTASLARVDFTGNGDNYAIPFRVADLAEMPDSVTHHLAPVRDGKVGNEPAYMPTCIYCNKTLRQINDEADKTEATRKPCPVALDKATPVPIRSMA